MQQLVDVDANRTHHILPSQITLWGGNVHEYANAQMRSVTASLTRFQVLFSHLFFSQHWQISPAFCCTLKLAESNKYTRKLSTTKCEKVSTYFETAKMLYWYFFIYFSSLIFPGHLVLDCKLHQNLSYNTQHYVLRLCSENKALVFLLHISSLVIKILDFQNSWQFKLMIHEAEMDGELCCTVLLTLPCWWLYRLCRGFDFWRREGSVHQREMPLVYWH